jgi:hypothetical protein
MLGHEVISVFVVLNVYVAFVVIFDLMLGHGLMQKVLLQFLVMYFDVVCMFFCL